MSSISIPNHWEIMEENDQEMFDKTLGWRQAISGNPVLTDRERQLILLGMACAIRHLNGVKAHAGHALKAGATKEEIFATVALSMIMGGCPSYGESVKMIVDLIK